MAKSSGKSTARRKAHGRTQLAVAAKRPSRVKAQPRGAPKHVQASAVPAPATCLVTSEIDCIEVSDDDFDPYDDLDNLLAEDE